MIKYMLTSNVCDSDYSLLRIIYIVLLITGIICHTSYASNDKERCEEISIPMCRGIGYNYTAMPNQFHHDTQEESGLEVHQFWPLVEIQCSDDLRFFLCSMYAPICIEDYQGRLPACRSVCERAKHGCAPIMRQYGFAWPERMDCNDLPIYGDQEHLCMDSKEGASPIDTREQTVASKPTVSIANKDQSSAMNTNGAKDKTTRPPFNRKSYPRGRERGGDHRVVPPVSGSGVVGFGSSGCKCECRHPMILLNDMTERRFNNRVETGSVSNCAVPCHGVFFSKPEKDVAVFWIGIFAIICCVCTSLTVLTFITDMERFRYPERSIIFLSGCYLMVSIGYIIRSYMGHEPIACDGPLIRYQRTGPAPVSCVVVFLLIYFFGMASSVWWVILTITWFLAAGLKWGNEAIAGYSQYFHLFAWFIPTVKSVTILGIGAIDGDPFTGVCYIGNQDLNNLLAFVILPYCAYIGLGFFFLLAGFISLFRIRKLLRERVKADKLEKLMIRIGFFSFLYIVPGTIVVGCYLYEYYYRDIWERHHNCPCAVSPETPYYSVFLLKYIMCLVVGITSGFWIWSGKTIDSWARFYSRICCGTSSGSSRSGASQLIVGSQYAIANSRTCKQQQITAVTHVSHCKQIPLSHV